MRVKPLQNVNDIIVFFIFVISLLSFLFIVTIISYIRRTHLVIFRLCTYVVRVLVFACVCVCIVYYHIYTVYSVVASSLIPDRYCVHLSVVFFSFYCFYK